MEILHNVDCFGRKAEESSLEGSRTLPRYPKERRWYFHSRLKRIHRTSATDNVSRQYKDYFPFQMGCSRYSTFSQGFRYIFKSLGVDGFYPALQRRMSRLHPILVPMLRGFVAFGYITNVRQNVKVIFIRKAGRQVYILAKLHRPISLRSFLLKTLERLSEKESRKIVLTKRPLYSNQHAYIPRIPRIFVDTALHSCKKTV